MTEETTLLQKLERLRGRAAAPPATARDPVSQSAIRRWCDAMGDRNPLYTQGVAPPAMLDAWTMPAFNPLQRPSMEVLDILDSHGFTATVATNLKHEYVRYIRVGDVISHDVIIESVSAEKKTKLGSGHFLDFLYTFRDQNAEVVGRMQTRLLKYKPPATAKAKPPHPRPNITRDNAFFWEGVQQQKLLFRRCASCKRIHHPPGPMCPNCHSLAWTVEESAGRGSIYSFVIYHHPAIPPFDTPNPIGLIQLDEGFRFVANLRGFDLEKIQIDARVTLEFVQADDTLLLPAFTPDPEQR